MTRLSTPTFTLSRADHRLLRVVLLGVPVVYLVTAVLAPVLGAARGRALTWPSQEDADPVDVPVTVQGGGRVVFDGAVVWTIPHPTPGQVLLAVLPALVTAALIVVGCWCLWRLLDRVRRRDPFGGHAARQVALLALLVMGYGLVVPFVRIAADFLITAPLREDPQTSFQFGPQALVPLFLGLLLVALAECFRYGSALRDDADGLV